MKVSAKHVPASAEFAQLARCRALGKVGGVGSQNAIAEEIGSPRVQRLVKGAVAALGTTSAETLVDAHIVSGAFAEVLRNSSAFYRLLDGGRMIRVPMQSRVGYVTAAASAWLVGEGKPIPLSSIGLADLYLDPQKVARSSSCPRVRLPWPNIRRSGTHLVSLSAISSSSTLQLHGGNCGFASDFGAPERETAAL